jgi:hypothetical protein
MAACNKSDAPQDAKPPPETKPAETKPAETREAATTAAPSAAPVPTPKLPPGRTTMPTLEEWAKMPKEVTVKGSSALNCETKILREYFRVVCRGKNDTGGTPTTLHVDKGGRGEALAHVGAGVTSLVVPFVEGTDLEVTFSWTDKSHKLVAKWPKGTKQPIVVGVFEGASSPLDAAKVDEPVTANAVGTGAPAVGAAPTTTAAALQPMARQKGDPVRLCDCFKKVMKTASCNEMMGAPDGDCDRTYSDCSALLECSRGDPKHPPRCLPDYDNSGALLRCMPTCGPDKPPCAKGTTCNSDFGVLVCMQD